MIIVDSKSFPVKNCMTRKLQFVGERVLFFLASRDQL